METTTVTAPKVERGNIIWVYGGWCKVLDASKTYNVNGQPCIMLTLIDAPGVEPFQVKVRAHIELKVQK